MNDEAVQADEEDLLSYEVSDEALEAAAGNEALPTATFICSGFCCQSWAADPLPRIHRERRQAAGAVAAAVACGSAANL
jgi:hypothetical protein